MHLAPPPQPCASPAQAATPLGGRQQDYVRNVQSQRHNERLVRTTERCCARFLVPPGLPLASRSEATSAPSHPLETSSQSTETRPSLTVRSILSHAARSTLRA